MLGLILQVNTPAFIEGSGGVITTTGGCPGGRGGGICARTDVEDTAITASAVNKRSLNISVSPSQPDLQVNTLLVGMEIALNQKMPRKLAPSQQSEKS
jgi:hypothetical protein